MIDNSVFPVCAKLILMLALFNFVYLLGSSCKIYI